MQRNRRSSSRARPPVPARTLASRRPRRPPSSAAMLAPGDPSASSEELCGDDTGSPHRRRWARVSAMAYVDAWDGTLEALTANLVAMAEGRGKPTGFRTDNGWLCAMAVAKQKTTVELSAPDPADPGLDDYEVVLVYNLSFTVPKPWPALPTFRKTLTLHEGYAWEE